MAVTGIAVPAISALPASAATELTVWSWRTEDKAFYESQIVKFEAKNPGITVKFTPYLNTEYNAIASTALTAGKGPDILQMRPYGGMANLSDAGNFLALTVKDVPALGKLQPGILAAAQGYKDKKQYGFPYAISAMGIYYNPEILQKAGVKALPTNWEQLMIAFNKVKAIGVLPWVMLVETVQHWNNYMPQWVQLFTVEHSSLTTLSLEKRHLLIRLT